LRKERTGSFRLDFPFSLGYRTEGANATINGQDLITRLKGLEDDLVEKKLHLEREQETTKSYQLMVKDARVKLKKLDGDIVGFPL